MNLYKTTFFIWALFVAYFTHAQTTISAGNVSGTWTKAGSPYKVNGNITIPNGSTLTIEPGVVVQFAQKISLKVDGKILAQGGAKSTDSIWFTKQMAHDTGSWKGIKFIKTATNNDTSLFKYCVFRNCKSLFDTALAYRSGGITVLGYGKVKIANSTFYNNEANIGASIFVTTNAYATIKACTFKNNKASQFWWWDGSSPSAYRVRGSAIALEYNSNAIIDSCNFKNNIRGKDYEKNPSILYEASVIDIEEGTKSKQTNISNCIFDGNEGITLYTYYFSFVTVNNCKFINAPKDKSLYLIYSLYLSDLQILNSSFSNNKGSTILNAEGSKISAINSEFKNNENWISIIQSDPSNKKPTLLLQSCKIINNNKALFISTHSSGITASTINNCLIANNKLDVLNSTSIINTSIINNSFGVDGIGGNPSSYPSSNASNINVINTIIWGNKLDSFPNKQILIYPNTTASFKNSIIENDTSTFGWYSYGKKLLKPAVYLNNLSTNPQFVNPTTGVGVGYNAATADFSLKSTCAIMSPAINTGSTDTTGLKLPKTDLAGNTRFYENRIDIGAYESTAGAPLISITQQAKNDSLCEKSRPAQLTLNAIGKGLSYQWQQSLNGGNTWSDISGQVNAKLSLINTTTTQNNVWYRAVLTGTCDKDTSLPKQIITHALPIVNLGADTAVCKNSTISKTTPTTGTYLWHTGNTTNTLNQTIKKDSIWWLQITSAQGCKNRDTLRIQSKALPTVNIGADRNLNKNAQLTLDAGAGASSYLWNNGLTTQTRTFYGQDLGAAGAYTLWAQVTGSNGCSARDSIVITVIDNSAIKAINTDGIKLYPQPARDVLNIVVANGPFTELVEVNTITLSSTDGKILYTQTINSNHTQIPIPNLETGIYIITVTCNNQTYTAKWVKA